MHDVQETSLAMAPQRRLVGDRDLTHRLTRHCGSTRCPILAETRALARSIRAACVGRSCAGSHRVVGTLQSGSALFMRYIDAATNAAWRTGMRSCTPRHALRHRPARSRPHRKRYGPTSRQIGNDHICEMISRAPRTPCQNKQSDLQDEYGRAALGHIASSKPINDHD